jgi:hypothetical protein
MSENKKKKENEIPASENKTYEAPEKRRARNENSE